MNNEQFLLALNETDETYIQQAGVAGGHFAAERTKRRPRLLIRLLLAAAIVLILSATVYAGGELIGMWNDRWLQTPNSDPVEVVREAVSRQIEKEFTLAVTVEKLLPDEAEAQRYFDHDRDSILCLFSGWGMKNPALEGKRREDVAAVYARYSVQYDHTKTWYRDGTLYQYFYLVRNDEGKWEIVDTSAEQELEPVPPKPDPDPGTAEGLTPDAAGAVRKVGSFYNAPDGYDYEAAFDPERTEAAIAWARGTVLAEGNDWTEAYLRENLAAVTICLRPGEGAEEPAFLDGDPEDYQTFGLLRDPATGEWYNTNFTAYIELLVKPGEAAGR